MKVLSFVAIASLCVAAGCTTTNMTSSMAATTNADTMTKTIAPVPENDTGIEQAQNPATQVADSEKPTEICRKERVTGSKFYKQVCATQEEWDQLGKQSREASEQMRNRTRTCTGGKNC